MALRRLKEFQQSIREHHDIELLGITLSFWDERGAVNRELMEEIEGSFSGKIFDSKVRRDIAVSRSTLKGKTVFDFDKSSRAAKDYEALTNEFLNRLSGSKGCVTPCKITSTNSNKLSAQEVKEDG